MVKFVSNQNCGRGTNMYKNEKIKRMCSFYASDIHLTTMMLPYLVTKVEKGDKIYTFLDHSIEKEIQILLSKLNLKNKTLETIKSINWKAKTEMEFSNTKEWKNIEGKKIYILVTGKQQNIQEIKQKIEKLIENDQNLKVNIINFFDINDINNDIKEILKNHDKVLNTSGEKEIEDNHLWVI